MSKEDTFETLRFLTPELCFEIADKVGSPCYAYDLETLKKYATECVAFPNAYGLTVRYAMKSWPLEALRQDEPSACLLLGLRGEARHGCGRGA